MKLHYHPPHLILVHFPAALFPMDLLCAALGLYLHEVSFAQASFYALAGGVAAGWLAVCFGFVDLVRIPIGNTVARRTALIHGGINTVVLLGYSVLLFSEWRHPTALATPAALILKGILLAGLIAGNYLGAQLVLKYRVGMIEEEMGEGKGQDKSQNKGRSK